MTAAVGEWRHALRIGWRVYRLELEARRRRHWLGLLWVFAPLVGVLALGFGVQSTRWAGELVAGPLPYPVYVVAGLTFWQSFADAVLMPQRQFATYRTDLARGGITIEQTLVVGMFDLCFATVLRIGFLLSLVALMGLHVSAGVAALPVFLALLMGTGLAIGAFAALPGLLVEDVGRALAIALALGIFASPVFYHRAALALVRWNPLTPWIDAARASATGQPADVAMAFVALVPVAAALVAAAAWLRAGGRHFLGPLA